MDRDEEKDLYIKAKLKDGHIPEKIDNLFNNSAKLVENIGGDYMGENNQSPKKNKNNVVLKRVAGIAACAVIALGGGNIYATTQGYDNVFFMIKEWISPSEEVYGKDEILSDRDITISYEPIQITENIRIVISKMQIKDNEAKIILSVNRSDVKENDGLPLEYKIYNSNKKILCEQISSEGNDSIANTYKEELILNKYSTEDTLLNLEIYTSEKELITTISIDLKNREINVMGQEEHLEKISEIGLKEFLGSISKQHVDDTAYGTCIDISNISYSNGYYTVTYTYCFLGNNSLFDIDINNIDIYQNTVAIKLKEDDTDSKFEVISMEEPIIIQKSKNEIDNSTSNTGTELWPDFAGTYALKSAFNQGSEIYPKEWATWNGNNWIVFHNDGTFTDTLFSKIFTDRLTVGGTYKFKNNSVILTYSNEQVVTLEGDEKECSLTGKIDEYDITLMGYSHTDLSKRDTKFVGGWYLEYGLDWSTGVARKIECRDLYDSAIYGEVYGANITLMENGDVEYTIAGKQKVSRRSGEWENVVISNNTIKVTLDDGTKIYMKYELDQNGKEYIGFQSKYNQMYYEYYSKNEKIEEEKQTNFKEGTYTLLNSGIKELALGENKIPHFNLKTYINLENNKFTIYNFPYQSKTTVCDYEVLDNNSIRCILEENRSIEFQIVEENKLKVTKLNTDDSESEFNIGLYDLFGENEEYVMYNTKNLTGTWKTSFVYKDMGGGEFWKTESNSGDYYFRFLEDGTYEQHYKEENYLYKGSYELENNQIDIDTNLQENVEMYLIDNDTILYILGTQYKVFLTRE